MNNKAHLRPKDFDSSGDIIPMNWKEEKGDLISREALKKAINANGCRHSHYFDIFDVIDNAPTIEPKLSDKQIEEIVDLLETNWGWEGIREEVTRILRGAE